MCAHSRETARATRTKRHQTGGTSTTVPGPTPLPKRRDVGSDYFTPNNRKERNLAGLRPRAARRGKRVNHLRQWRKQKNTMEDKRKEKKITGPGGTPRPGTAETTEQVSAGSLSSGCKATACGVDPRPCSQRTTGMTKPNITMNKVKKGKKLTGAGEFGGPRPGVEGMQRVPSASSDNRRGEQAEDQACSSANTTGTRTRSVRRGSCGADTPLLISEGSSSSEASPTSRGTRAKRRKRTRASTTPPFSGVTQGSDSESETSCAVFRAPPPSPSRSATDEERMAKLRHAPSANLAANLLEVTDDLERIAATSGNLKSTYIRRLRDDAGKTRASATELAKRVTAAGEEIFN